MAKTNIFPEIYMPFVLDGMLPVNNILSQAVRLDTNPGFKTKGEFTNVPHLKSLDDISVEPVQIADYSTEVTPGTSDDYDIKYGSFEIAFGLKESAYEQIRRGTDSPALGDVAQLGTQVGTKINQVIQDWYVSMMSGLYDATAGVLRAGNYVDSSSGSMSLSVLQSGLQSKVGELYPTYDKIIMHSAVSSDLFTKGLISLLPYAPIAQSVFQGGAGAVKRFGNLTVIENDTFCAPTDGVYPNYVLRGQPLYLGFQRQIRTLDWTKPNVGGGTYEKYWYVDLGIALDGVHYNSSSSVTQALLATAGTWELKLAAKKVGIIRIDTTIAQS